VPPGTAVFEKLSDKLYIGLIRDPATSTGGAYRSGLVDYCETDGTKVSLIYSPDDLVVC
jgi:hypothetical protein